MRRLLLLPFAGLAAALVVAVAGAATQTVQLTRNGFTPQNLTISVGDTVTWHNAAAVDLAADQLVEVGHLHSSPPSSSARRESALRVRVFTVPSGMPRKLATSVCDNPLQ